MNTKHASIRAQQRGIPPLITTWLLTYGEEQHDGHGAIIRFFSRKSFRRMERDIGREPLRRLSEWHGCYLLEAIDSGKIITIGHRSVHIRRP